jgi:hypothetical protein
VTSPDGEDELLEPGRPAMSRPARIAGAVLLVAVVVAVFAVRFWPSSNPKTEQGALGTPPPAAPQTSTVQTARPGPERIWTTAPSACGGTTELPLVQTLVQSGLPSAHTGMTLLLGGRELRAVDFDSGLATAWPAPGRQGFIATLTATLPGYATTMSCRAGTSSRLLRIDTDHSVEDLGPLDPDQSVLADGEHAWIATAPNRREHPTLQPIGGGQTLQLPPGTYPDAIEDGTIIATHETTGRPLVLLDSKSGRVERTIPHAGYPLAAGAGLVLWTSGCDPTANRPCVLDVLHLAGDLVTHVPLPRTALTATINADGSQVALLMESARTGPYAGHPFPPSNIAVLNLRTQRVRTMPGITVPAKTNPGLAFSPDGRWLAIAIDAGTKTRLLAWRAGGTSEPIETASVPGRNYSSPPLIALGG